MNIQQQPTASKAATSMGLSRYIVALFICTAVTWLIGLSDIHYRGEAVLAFAEGFPGDLSLWRAAGEKSNVSIGSESIEILRKTPGRSYAIRQFPLPKPESDEVRIVRATGVISTEEKTAANPNSKAAAYMIWFLDKDQTAIQYSTIQNLTGDFSEYRAERILSIPVAANFLVLAMHNNESNSHFALKYASASQLSVGSLYRYIGPVLFGTWALLMGFTVFQVAKTIDRRQAAFLALLIIAIFSGTLLPEAVSTGYVLPVLKWLSAYFAIDENHQLGFTYKLGHFFFFLLIALFALTKLVTKYRQRTAIILILILFAVATEGLQLHFFHRSTRLWDLAIDFVGIALAILLTWPQKNKTNPN